jgi:hypothetical protein
MPAVLCIACMQMFRQAYLNANRHHLLDLAPLMLWQTHLSCHGRSLKICDSRSSPRRSICKACQQMICASCVDMFNASQHGIQVKHAPVGMAPQACCMCGASVIHTNGSKCYSIYRTWLRGCCMAVSLCNVSSQN